MTTEPHVLLREYIERVITEKEERNCERFQHFTLRFNSLVEEREKALEHRMHALDIRLSSMNALREQLNGQAGTFLTRDRYDLQHQGLLDRVGDLEKWRSELVGKAARSNVISIAALVVSTLALLVHFFK